MTKELGHASATIDRARRWRHIVAIAALLFALAGCDKFAGYTVWATNTSGEGRIIVLTQAGGPNGGQLPTYVLPSDGQMRQTKFVVTAAPPDALVAEIFVYDDVCRLLGRFPFHALAGTR